MHTATSRAVPTTPRAVCVYCRMEFIPIHDLPKPKVPNISDTRGVRVQLLRDVVEVTHMAASPAVDFALQNIVSAIVCSCASVLLCL